MFEQFVCAKNCCHNAFINALVDFYFIWFLVFYVEGSKPFIPEEKFKKKNEKLKKIRKIKIKLFLCILNLFNLFIIF